MFHNNTNKDITSIVTYADVVFTNIYASISARQETPDIHYDKLKVLVNELYEEFPNLPISKASAFKKSAYFLMKFCSAKPITSNFPSFGKYNTLDLQKYNNFQNEIIAFDFVRFMLEKSVIKKVTGDTILDHKIQLSSHSYEDLIQTLGKLNGGNDYVFLSLLIEQMVYRVNPKASYSTVV